MSKWWRYLLLYAGTGPVFMYAMRCLFIWSNAQAVLGNPAMQSAKFIQAFIAEPLPRMAAGNGVLWAGFYVAGISMATAFLIVNAYVKGHVIKRGLLFGFVNWLLMTPWFEFYMPYNVMLEPLPLVLLEAFLWLCVLLITGLYMSMVVNWRR